MLNNKYFFLLKKNIWFDSIPESFQEFILATGKLIYLEKNEVLFYKKNNSDGIYIIIEGTISLTYLYPEGKESIFQIIEPLVWFGEISLIDKQPRSYNAICINKSIVLHIPESLLIEKLNINPSYWYYIALLISQKIRYLSLIITANQTHNIPLILAQRLILILNGYGNYKYNFKNNVKISQEQLANMLSISRQKINSELNKLEKEGIIKIGFRQINILKLEELKAKALL